MGLAIGIPTYNQAAFLGQTLKSLLNQRVAPSQIVVSDNHSTDDTGKVLAEFRHDVTVISPPTHQRIYEHFNFVASRLEDEWIALLGSDDIAKPTFVEDLSAGTTRVPDAVLVRAGYEIIDGDGNPLSQQRILSVRRIERWPRTLFQQLTGPRANLSATAVRRSAWQTAGRFPEHLNLHADWALYLGLCRLGSFVYEPAIVSQYRVAYRHGLEATRLLGQLEDERYIAMQLIPGLLDCVHPATRVLHLGTIRSARRRRFREQLAHASSILSASERAETFANLTLWARSAGCVSELDAFRNGERIKPPRQIPPLLLRRAVRKGYNGLAAVRRRPSC